MKVKLFWKNAPVGNGDVGAHAFEKEINAWLRGHPRIKVVDVKQASCGGSFGSSLWFVSVWYEEGAAEPAVGRERGSMQAFPDA